MDDLLREFLTETSESLDTVDNQLVKFEQEPNNAKILDNIFRLVHTIKGTCGFLGLPRLEALAHAGETLMGKFRDGMPVTAEAVTVILSSIDRIKEILAGLEATEAEPEGNDRDLIGKLEAMGRANFYGSTIDERGQREEVGSETLVDLELNYRVDHNVTVIAGASNLFNNFPDEIDTRLSQGMPYPRRTPIGYHGGMAHLRLVYTMG